MNVGIICIITTFLLIILTTIIILINKEYYSRKNCENDEKIIKILEYAEIQNKLNKADQNIYTANNRYRYLHKKAKQVY